METTERIVESYCRYVKGWFTISNLKCAGQYEIDLLAIEVTPEARIRRYHIESGVSVSGPFSKLTAKPFSQEKLKERLQQSGQRRTVGYFIHRKFGPREVVGEIARFGFKPSHYTKVIVTWGWEEEARVEAERNDIVLWDFRQILTEIAQTCRGSKAYFGDDTLRTIQLIERSKSFEFQGRDTPRDCHNLSAVSQDTTPHPRPDCETTDLCSLTFKRDDIHFGENVRRCAMSWQPFQTIWQRILQLQEEEFRTKTGLPFTYSVESGTTVWVERKGRIINQSLGKSNFEQVYSMMQVKPIKLISQINDRAVANGESQVRGPSFVWAILHDKRVVP